ncbi:hypothetical protein BDF14DRAFT_1885841 [Spinellus fusiger]|nr:hypothetical protein BDF14DRAFT_1887409 [Spinellus fusiger]KAI7862660.1 hypothetical protein BDF14DRAFT_1885841 [Spinellus fusiger]
MTDTKGKNYADAGAIHASSIHKTATIDIEANHEHLRRGNNQVTVKKWHQMKKWRILMGLGIIGILIVIIGAIVCTRVS